MSLDPSTLEAAQKQAKADGKRKDAERRASMAISIDSMPGMGGAAGGAGGGGRRRSVSSVASSSTGPSKSNRRNRVSPAKAGGSKVSGGASVSSGRTGGSNASPYASTAKWEPSGGKQLATTSLYTASVLAYQPRSEPADARAFKRAGQGKNLRDGSFGDNTAVPALITFPKVLQSGKEQIIAKNKHDWPGGDLYGQLWSEGREKWPDQEKSYTAMKIMDDLREKQMNKVTGRNENRQVPLYHRVTSEPIWQSGARMYSGTVGHAMATFQEKAEQPDRAYT